MLKLLKAFIAKLSAPAASQQLPVENVPIEISQHPSGEAKLSEDAEMIYGDGEMTENLRRLILSEEEAHIEMAFQILKGAKHAAVKQIPTTASIDTKKLWMCAWFLLPLPEKNSYYGYYNVYLKACQLNQVPDFLGELSSRIHILKLTNNQLKELPETFRYREHLQSRNNWDRLREINLSHNQLTEFPHLLWTRRRLESLNLSYNKIEEVSETLAGLSSLQKLYLGHNRLTQFPEIIHKLTFLRVLHLAGNQISSLPDDISKIDYLKEINLSNNRLADFPQSLIPIKSLSHLDLSNNAIPSLSADVFANWTMLRELHLNNNNIRSCSISQLPKLRSLFLAGNNLEELVFARESLPKLRKFHLQNNRLNYLPLHLSNLKELRELRLYDNNLKSLPDEIGALTRLEYLSLDKNTLTALPDSIQNLKQLKQLDLLENPLSDAEKIRIQSLLPHTKIRF